MIIFIYRRLVSLQGNVLVSATPEFRLVTLVQIHCKYLLGLFVLASRFYRKQLLCLWYRRQKMIHALKLFKEKLNSSIDRTVHQLVAFCRQALCTFGCVKICWWLNCVSRLNVLTPIMTSHNELMWRHSQPLLWNSELKRHDAATTVGIYFCHVNLNLVSQMINFRILSHKFMR